MKWKFVIPLQTAELINKYEEFSGYKFTDAFKEIIMNYNAGRPEKWIIDLESGNRILVKKLLSFNPDDKDSIWNIVPDEDMLPFMLDSFGNHICLNKNNNEILFIKKTGQKEYIADNIEDFLEKLHR